MACTCHGCKQSYTTDVIVDDKLWEKIYTEDSAKAKQGGGLLCPHCIMSRLVKLGDYASYNLSAT